MKYNKIGQNMVSSLGFGCMRFPVGDGKIDYPAAEALIDRAMAAGINYFDTAWFYHGGESETFLKKALVERYPRDSFFIADKLPAGDVQSPQAAEDERFKVQLDRCGLEYFDYYLLHGIGTWAWDHCKSTGIDKWFFDLKERGLAKHTAFSFHDSPEALEYILSQSPDMWAFCMFMLNYHDWTAQNAEKMYEICCNYNLPVIAMEPVRGGSLANMNEKTAEVFKTAEPDMSVASWALRFCGSLPNVVVTLSGMTTMEQLLDNINIFDNFKPFTDADRAVLKRAMEAAKALPLTGCTQCRYCTSECPLSIDIPNIFRLHDYYHTFNSPRELAEWYLKHTPEEKLADKCTGCSLCSAKCPQKLDIPMLLEKVHATAVGL